MPREEECLCPEMECIAISVLTLIVVYVIYFKTSTPVTSNLQCTYPKYKNHGCVMLTIFLMLISAPPLSKVDTVSG